MGPLTRWAGTFGFNHTWVIIISFISGPQTIHLFTNSDISFFFFLIWEHLGEPQETEVSLFVLVVVYSVHVATSLDHLVTLKERGSRRKNMGVSFPVGPVVRIHLPQQETRRCGFDPWVEKIPWRRK